MIQKHNFWITVWGPRAITVRIILDDLLIASSPCKAEQRAGALQKRGAYAWLHWGDGLHMTRMLSLLQAHCYQLWLLTYSSKCVLSCDCWTCSCKCFVSSPTISVWWSYALIVNVLIQICSFLWLLNLFLQMFCFFPSNFHVVKLRSDC